MTRVVLALLVAFQFGILAQTPGKTAPAPKTPAKTTSANDIFSGTVTASAADAVTVVRKVPAKPDEYRTFSIDRDTKIEGNLRVNARVSVRFQADDGGAIHALRVIVRP